MRGEKLSAIAPRRLTLRPLLLAASTSSRTFGLLRNVIQRSSPSRYVTQAIDADAAFFRRLLDVVLRHPERPLILFGLVPIASMFVLESHALLRVLRPEVAHLLSEENLSLIRPARHRAKLLLTNRKEVHEIANEIARIVVVQRDAFLDSHTGLLAWLKRRFQPDMGVFLYEGHLFSSTHAAIFGFGTDDGHRHGRELGYLLGRYVSTVAPSVEGLERWPGGGASGRFEMRDIKYESLYRRGALGTLELGFAAACSLVLASVNMTHRVLRSLVGAQEPLFFKFKFLCAYHAQSSIQLIQDVLRPAGRLPPAAAEVFSTILRHPCARWLRGREHLRELLVHYDSREARKSPADASFDDVVDRLLGQSRRAEVDTSLDEYLEHVAVELSRGFHLKAHTFWYGTVTRQRAGHQAAAADATSRRG